MASFALDIKLHDDGRDRKDMTIRLRDQRPLRRVRIRVDQFPEFQRLIS